MKPLVSMIARMIRSKLWRPMIYSGQIWEQPYNYRNIIPTSDEYPPVLRAAYSKAFKVGTYASKQLAEHDDILGTLNPNIVRVTWHKNKCTTPLKYSLDCPHLSMTRVEKE